MLYQNDDFGKDYLVGLRQGLGDKADKMIVAIKSYETTDPTVNSQIVALQASGADVLLTAAVPKFGAQSIRKVFDIGWKPTHFLGFPSSSIGGGAAAGRAGKEHRHHLGDCVQRRDRSTVAGDARIQGVAGLDAEILPVRQTWPIRSTSMVTAAARRSSAVLKACGDNLTRENVMKQAASLHDLKLPMLLPGITLSTSADDYQPIKQMQLQKFDGNTWKLFGEVISGSGS